MLEPDAVIGAPGRSVLTGVQVNADRCGVATFDTGLMGPGVLAVQIGLFNIGV